MGLVFLQRNNNYHTMLPELRVAVKCSIDENINHPENYAREGKWMRHGVEVLLAENHGLLPDRIPIAPSLSLQTASAELQRPGQTPDLCQSVLHDVWFKHINLIMNAVERSLS